AKAQGMFRDADSPEAVYSEYVSLDMSSVVPSLAGHKRPQDRIALTESQAKYREIVEAVKAEAGLSTKAVTTTIKGQQVTIDDGAVVIAAITSCTNTSNPSVMLGAGLVARKAAALGLNAAPWVKTSLGPGSLVVTEYLDKAGLTDDLNALGFNTVGYGCTTCISNSGPLPAAVSAAIAEGDLAVTSVLSGNRNFEGRVHAEVRMNYLASPPLVVAYAIAGTMNIDLYNDPVGQDKGGNNVFLKDIWPSQKEVADVVASCVTAEQFEASYGNVYAGDSNWQNLAAPSGDRFAWDANSTYIQHPPYFEGMTFDLDPVSDIKGARVLALLGDSVTTDHISPAGAIKADSPAGRYLQENGVDAKDFNSYGSRRGNHEIMMRGTFANIRLRNNLAPGTEGGVTLHQPSNALMSIYDAAMQYKQEGVASIIIAGKEYGSGSSRDWAAKGPRLQGVQAVIAETYERIHRSNLVGMGILPLQFKVGQSAASLGLSGQESYDFSGLGDGSAKELNVTATAADGSVKSFSVDVRIDTPKEVEYYQHGGILHYVLRQLADPNASQS
ncbi:MAG: aconitate hydratase, partial [Mariprofundus sp.]